MKTPSGLAGVEPADAESPVTRRGSARSERRPRTPARLAGFRWRLLLAMMLAVSVVTLVALFVAQDRLEQNVARELEQAFQAELATLQRTREIRQVALVERCRALVRKPRIHAALEDDALDLLYPSAEDELRDIMAAATGGEGLGLQAEFYRFLDRNGRVIPTAGRRAMGWLEPSVEAQLALPSVPAAPQAGYVVTTSIDGVRVLEILAHPIVSTETGEAIAALVLGFKPFELRDLPGAGMRSGIWLGDRLHSETMSAAMQAELADALRRRLDGATAAGRGARVMLKGEPHLVFVQALNPGASYPRADEVCVYSLAGLAARQRELRWQVIGGGALLLSLGLVVSHVAAGRLSAPVERLAVDSENAEEQRARAEAALEMTHAELQRAARFSADASHQLKTPVTVLRAGLEELLAAEHRDPAECEQISALIHQTYRLSSLVEDLLLLSRMDAGRLRLEPGTVDVAQLIAASLDDLSALPDERALRTETDFPPELWIAGEKRYTAIILQNLLENARKYNEPGGVIRIRAWRDAEWVRVAIANTGRPIPPAAQPHIFERFHRAAVGENVPGYGLGLNLARELARLHGGDLRLIRSDATGTEFEASFRRAERGAA